MFQYDIRNDYIFLTVSNPEYSSQLLSTQQHSTPQHSSQQLSSQQQSSQQHSSKHLSLQQHCSQETHNTSREFEFQVLRKLTTISLKMQQIAEDVTDIKESLKEKDSNKRAEEELNYQFPIDSFESFENFERFLKDTREYNKFVSTQDS